MNWLQKIANAPIPPEPGTAPIPQGYVRLYHYFPPDQIESVRQQGIDLGCAKGEAYGEPNCVWASGKRWTDRHTYVEFSVSKDDPGWQIGKPYSDRDAQAIQDEGWHVTFGRTIRPEEFIAIHEPWHHHYRYIMNDPQLLQEVLNGDHDHLLDDEEYAPAIKLIKGNSTGFSDNRNQQL